MRSISAVLALSSLLGAACGYRPVDVEALAITTPPLAAPPRIAAPLFLIRDTARIPQTLTAKAPNGPEVVVENLPLLLERDLKAALGALFDSVTVVDPSAQVPAGDRLVGLFAVEELSLAQQGTTDGAPRYVGAVRFRFELWLPGAETQAYRFAGTAFGAEALGDRRSGERVFASAFASAIYRVSDGIARSGAAARLSSRR